MSEGTRPATGRAHRSLATRRLRAAPVVVGFALILVTLELTVRLAAGHLSPPQLWSTPEAQLKVDQVRARGHADAVILGSSIVDVSIDPPVMNVACNAFPRLVTINVQITTNGPATVIWRWEEMNTGDISEEKNMLFNEGGIRSAQDLYQVKGARDYRLIVRTLLPNEVTGEATFKAICTP